MRILIPLFAALALSAAALPAQARNIEAGPIWNQQDAQVKCPTIAAHWKGKWTGHWWTTVQGKMSVCEIVKIPNKNVEVGPIWNQADAQKKCAAIAGAERAEWTGHWWTTVPGKMSVCQLDYN